MEETRKVMRRSVYTYLKGYQYFSSTPALLAFPYAVSVLLSQALLPSPSSLILFNRLRTLSEAAGFPSSEFFTILSFRFSQTVSASILTLPFTLTFFLITKASVIQALNQQKPSFPPSFLSVMSVYKPLLSTYICNIFVIVAANATVFCFFFLAFNCLDGFTFSSSAAYLLILSAVGAVLYSVVLANALVICNLALVVSAMEKSGGCLAILKACVLIRGRTSTALSMTLPVNLTLAAIEALFHFRVVRAYRLTGKPRSSLALEGISIAYLYSVFVVLDAIINTVFFRVCRIGYLMRRRSRHHHTEIADEDNAVSDNSKTPEDLP